MVLHRFRICVPIHFDHKRRSGRKTIEAISYADAGVTIRQEKDTRITVSDNGLWQDIDPTNCKAIQHNVYVRDYKTSDNGDNSCVFYRIVYIFLLRECKQVSGH